jgi:hypothetical protein
MYYNINMASNFTIFSQPYYDTHKQCYKNIITINTIPNGPLKKLTKQIKLNKLSPFQVEGPCTPIEKCTFALINMNHHCCGDLMTPDELPFLFSFLLSNGYQIETQLTKLLYQSDVKISISNKKIITNVSYYPNQQPNITYMR